MELAILDTIQQTLRSPFMDGLMVLITRLANNGLLWLVIACLLTAVKKYRRGGLTLFLTLAIEFIVNDFILKNIFHRPRPCDITPQINLLINHPGGWSMPSGHTASSFAAAAVIYHINKKWGTCAFILAAVIGFSRMYLYVHFPTDVLAGAMVGLLSGCAGIAAVNRVYKGGFSC